MLKDDVMHDNMYNTQAEHKKNYLIKKFFLVTFYADGFAILMSIWICLGD